MGLRERVVVGEPRSAWWRGRARGGAARSGDGREGRGAAHRGDVGDEAMGLGEDARDVVGVEADRWGGRGRGGVGDDRATGRRRVELRAAANGDGRAPRGLERPSGRRSRRSGVGRRRGGAGVDGRRD